MSCTRACHRPSPTQAHCTSCHRTFGGAAGFDKHRRDGRCLDPAGLGMTPDWRGVWRRPTTAADRIRLSRLRNGPAA